MGAGSAEGSLDAANILRPALSRGKIQGTLTLAAKRLKSKITFDENALVLALQDRNADA